MTISVVDTTVIAVANDRAGHATAECIRAAIAELSRLKRHGHVALDSAYEIFKEYRRYSSMAGEPGVGDEFVKHIFDNMYNTERCSLVDLTPHNEREFEEFPDDPSLSLFDRSDRKFVCVALGCSPTATIANAGDRGWRQHEDALRSQGVALLFLC